MELSWIIFALAFSIVTIANTLVAEFFKGRMLYLLFWQRVFALLAFFPVLFFLPPPDDPVFYLATVGASLIFCYTDLLYYGLAQKSGAGVVSRVEPLSSWLLFFVWAAFTPSLLLEYLNSPLQLAGIILSLTGCVYFALRLRHCDLSWSVLKRLLPVIFLSVVGLVFSKTAMDYSSLHSGIFYYGLVQSVFAVGFYALLSKLRFIPTLRELDILDAGKLLCVPGRHLLVFGLMLGGALVVTQLLKYYAISLAENPAYVMIFGLLSPFWILLFYKLVGREEKVDILSGIGIVVCTAIMVVFTQF